jgi:hypothetical protein
MKKAIIVICTMMAAVISVGFSGTSVKAEGVDPWNSGEIQSGKGHPFVCTDWKVGHLDLKGMRLKFMTGFQRLPNGNTVMSN